MQEERFLIMKNEEILSLAIDKAVKDGFNIEQYDNAFKKINGKWELWDGMWLEHIIFSHKFAKAIFGENIHCCANFNGDFAEAWKCKLQEMVVQEDPIKYLEEFISPSRS